MEGRAVRLHRSLDHALDVEIGHGRPGGSEHDDLAASGVRSLSIGFADREHRHDAERIARAGDPDCDLPAVRDQQAMEQRRRHAPDAITS